MSAMLDKRKQAPMWQKRLLAMIFLCGAVLAVLLSINFIQSKFSDSPRARLVKNALAPLADQLEAAERLGDKSAAIVLLDPITKILNDYNDADDQVKARINNSDLRFCHLAAMHLSTGITDFFQNGYWLNKAQYKAAMDACR